MTRARDLADLVGGGGSLPAATSIGDVSSTELGYLDGVTSALQTQISGKLATPGAWTSYTPELTAATTNPNTGSTGLLLGKYIQIGKIVHAKGFISFSGTGVSGGSGTYYLGLPVTAVNDGTNMQGSMWLYEGGANKAFFAIPADVQVGGTKVNMYLGNGGGITVTDTNPWAWGGSDQIRWNITYEAA